MQQLPGWVGTITCLIVSMEGFEALGFKGWHYGRCNTADVGEFIEKLRQPSTGGGSVTIPLKVPPNPLRHRQHTLVSCRVRTDGACGPTGWKVCSIFGYLLRLSKRTIYLIPTLQLPVT